MTRLIVTDSGATEREISRLLVVDSGGTTRELARAFVIDSGGTARRFFSAGTVTLSGESVDSVATDPANAIARIWINADGTVDKTENGTTSQVDASTDWVIPNAVAPDDYEVRFTNLVGTSPTVTGGTAEDAWYPLSSGDFTIALIQGSVGTKACSFDIEIRKGSSGSATATGSYALSAQVDP